MLKKVLIASILVCFGSGLALADNVTCPAAPVPLPSAAVCSDVITGFQWANQGYFVVTETGSTEISALFHLFNTSSGAKWVYFADNGSTGPTLPTGAKVLLSVPEPPARFATEVLTAALNHGMFEDFTIGRNPDPLSDALRAQTVTPEPASLGLAGLGLLGLGLLRRKLSSNA